MKKLIFFVSVICLCIFLLASCGEKAPASDATISFIDGNDIKSSLDVNLLSVNTAVCIRRSDTATMPVKEAVAFLRDAVTEKLGVDVKLSTGWGSSGGADVEIIVGRMKDTRSEAIAESLKESDYKIVHEGNKIYIGGGSDDAVVEAVEIFKEYFLYGSNKALLVPAGGEYNFLKNFFFGNIVVDGVDISEFSIYSAGDKASSDFGDPHTLKMAKGLSELFETTLIGKKLPVTEVLEGEHLIIFEAYGIDAGEYSVEIRDGNIYILGSYISVDTAYEAFLSEVLGYNENEQLSAKNITLSAENNVSGDLDFKVPYTKEQLLNLFKEVSDSDEMVMAGTHCYNGNDGRSWIQNASDKTFEDSGQRPAIIETDLGRHSIYFNTGYQGEVVTPYDLSNHVASAAEHVDAGGIISVALHLANPLMNAPDTVWYRGVLGSEETARELVTDGTELNAMFRETLKSTLMLVEALDKNGIPFMFRPLHEVNGNWFWWCVKQGGIELSQEVMRDMWIYIYNIVTVEMGIENAVWVYSPNYDTGGTADVMYAYPGDEYVDIVGLDWYTNGNYEFNNNNGFDKIMATGKPSALTEFGPNGSGPFAVVDSNGNKVYTWTCEDLLNTLKQMLKDGYKVSYFLTWTGSGSIAGLDNTDILMNDPLILSREDLAEYWANLK